jgi:hypothetical protein
MNHTVPGVNEGYITRDKLLNDHLRQQQERISAIVLDQAGKVEGGRALYWLKSSRTEIPAARTETRTSIKLAA